MQSILEWRDDASSMSCHQKPLCGPCLPKSLISSKTGAHTTRSVTSGEVVASAIYRQKSILHGFLWSLCRHTKSRSALCKNRIQLLFIDPELDPGTELTVTSNLYSRTGTTHISGVAAPCHHQSHDSGLLCFFIFMTTFVTVFHSRENTWATR